MAPGAWRKSPGLVGRKADANRTAFSAPARDGGFMKVTDADVTRRGFMQTTLAAGVAVGTGARSAHAAESKNGVPYRVLGKTGEQVSAVGLGGFHIGVQAT